LSEAGLNVPKQNALPDIELKNNHEDEIKIF
jgi:hypothetical protein